jgi:tetratricopeptide (TPR) repeat protein
MHGEFDKVIEHGKIVLELMRRKRLQNDFIITTFYTMAQAYQALGRTEAAEKICLEALDFFPKHLDACHVLAAIYFRKQSLNLCREISLRYLQLYDEFDKNPSCIGSFYCHSAAKRSVIHFGLACIHFLEKDFDTADAYFTKSFEDADRDAAKAKNICRFYLEKNHNERALHWLTLACEASEAGDLSATDIGKTAYEAAEVFCRRKLWPLAEQALKTAVKIAPDNFDHGKFDRLIRGSEPGIVQS